MAKDSPKRGALTVIREGTATVGIQIDPWALDAPAIDYFADICSARLVAGTPTLIFAQLGPDDSIINAIAIAMPGKNFQEVIASFDPVVQQLDPGERAAGLAKEPVEIRSPLTSDHYRKFSASLIRGGISAEGGGMMDFYRVGIVVQQQLESGIPADLLQPCVRVFMAPSTMVQLLDIIRKRGLV